jgi:hypothetical protein
MEIQTSIFQMTTPLFQTVNHLVNNLSENVDVSE